MRAKMLVLVAILATVLPSLASGPDVASPTGNVRITIELGRLESGKKSEVRHYECVTLLGEKMDLNIGNRVPFPATTDPSASESETPVPVASYTYQNVGLTANLMATRSERGRIEVAGDIAASMLGGLPPDVHSSAPPKIGTITRRVNVLLDGGKPQRILTAEEPSLGTVYIELKAETID